MSTMPEETEQQARGWADRLRTAMATIPVLVIVAFSLYSATDLSRKAIGGDGKPKYNSEFAALDERLAVLEGHLPQRGTLGYLNLGERGPSGVLRVRAFMYSQKALAPLLLHREGEYPLTIGNFDDAEGTAEGIEIAADRGLQVLLDFGNGIVIFERAETE